MNQGRNLPGKTTRSTREAVFKYSW